MHNLFKKGASYTSPTNPSPSPDAQAGSPGLVQKFKDGFNASYKRHQQQRTGTGANESLLGNNSAQQYSGQQPQQDPGKLKPSKK